MDERRVARVLPEHVAIDDGDMLLRRALPVDGLESLGPFVFLDHYRHRSRRGIGDRPHPHAGIEVISYLLDGGVEHRDSLGPGDAQWIRAGRGMLHAEQPTGGRHGLQLWTSLPPAMKLAEPDYASFRAADIPRLDFPGASVRVIAGSVDGVAGPMRNATPTLFAHVRLEPGATLELGVDAEELGAYVLEGAIAGPDGAALAAGTLVVFGPGATVALRANADGPATVALLGGDKAEGPLVFDGPFVMDTPERIVQAKRDFLAGNMGRLDGVPF